MIDDRRGNMPFAVIAVTLLLLASVAAAVAAEQARVNSGIDSTMDSATGLERALDDVQSYVNQELGVIILDISKNDSLGGLDERADAFKERAYSWIDDRFPMGYGEVTVKLNGRTLDLTAEWNKYYPEGSLVQGCVIATKDFVEKHPAEVKKFLEEYKNSIEYVKENPNEASDMIAAQGIFAQAAVAKKAIPKCNLIYVDGAAMKSAMQTFLAAMPAPSIGGKLPDDAFYYRA